MHVLKDEKLGVDREYVAVSRKAEVGETIYTLVDGDGYFVEGEYGVVYDVGKPDVRAKFKSNYENGNWFISHGNYYVLEPTDIVHIDGERYRLEDRKANVGEKIIITNSDDFPIGFVDSVSDFDDFHDDGSCTLVNGFDGDDYFDGLNDHYNVLTPVQDAAEPQESDVITVLANLGTEVAELKRAVARHQAEINALHEDKVRLGEQLAKVAADDPKALSFTADELAQILIALKKAGL